MRVKIQYIYSTRNLKNLEDIRIQSQLHNISFGMSVFCIHAVEYLSLCRNSLNFCYITMLYKAIQSDCDILFIDINTDGVLDEMEVEALFQNEVCQIG